MIKKILLITTLFITLLIPVLTMQSVGAVDPLAGPCNDQNAASQPEICKDNKSGSSDNPIYGKGGILTVMINLLALLVGIISVVIIIVEGMRMALSGGDPNIAATARRGILYSCVGLAIALVSESVVALVLNKL